MRPLRVRGFTLVEVLVALMIVAMALAALMSSISSTARGSEYLRDKTMAQWIAMNRISSVRLNIQKFGENTDTGEVDFGNRHWRYDTRYFDTDNTTIRRVTVRVWLSTAKEKDAPLAESASFLGSAMAVAGSSNGVDWTTASGASTTGVPAAISAPQQMPSGTGSSSGFDTATEPSGLDSSTSASAPDSLTQPSGTSSDSTTSAPATNSNNSTQ